MKSANRVRLSKVLLTVLLCFTVYLSLAPVLLDTDLHRSFAA
jgi:hypothetical protein